MRLELAVLVTACGSPGTLDLTHGEVVTGTPAVPAEAYGTPVPLPANISSTFGPRWKPSANRYDFHLGIDYYDALGTPVLAIGAGVVDAVHADGSTSFPNGGNVLVVRHTLATPRMFHGVLVDRFYAVYLHLQSFAVNDGDSVVAGQTIGAMGGTGDTNFVHLHFETRVQTMCSLPYQLANPSSSCALGFDPHVHPFTFVGGADVDAIAVSEADATTIHYTATRGDLDLDVIATDQGTIGFSTREGLDATSLGNLDNFDRGWVRIVAQPFVSSSTELVYELHFTARPKWLELRDIHGHGMRFDRD